jgi:hypothetical protein
MSLLVLAAVASASGGYEEALLGDVFPVFDVEEHCLVMASSSSVKIRHLAKTCAADEEHDRELARQAWNIASQGNRVMCELRALSGVGSYGTLISCLNAETALEFLLDAPKRSQH